NVNNILQRLSSYASNTIEATNKNKLAAKKTANRSSSMSSISSNDEKLLDDDNDELSSLDNNSLKLNGSEFDDEESFESSFEHDFMSEEFSDNENDDYLKSLNDDDLGTFFQPKILQSENQNDSSSVHFNKRIPKVTATAPMVTDE